MKSKDEQIKAYIANIPNTHDGSMRRQYKKALDKKSMRSALNCHCLDCMCWSKGEVKRCDIVTCSLHAYRPFQKKEEKRGMRTNGTITRDKFKRA